MMNETMINEVSIRYKPVNEDTKFPPLPEGYVWGDCSIVSYSPDIHLKNTSRWIASISCNFVGRLEISMDLLYPNDLENIVFDEEATLEEALQCLANMAHLGVFEE